MSKDYCLLNHLDEPVRFLFFTMDEFIVILAPFMIGMFMDQMLVGMLAGFGLYQLLKLINRSFGGANLRQIGYWYLPTANTMLQLKIPSYIRELQG